VSKLAWSASQLTYASSSIVAAAGGHAVAGVRFADGPLMRASARALSPLLVCAAASRKRCMAVASNASHAFGPYRVAASEVFCETALSLGFVNLKPVVPGAPRHVRAL
jgi:hypothetical protein